MNVLIVGNGFDIAHKLPTKYTSFLDFIKFINRFETYHGTAQEFKLDNENYKFSQLDTDVQKYIIGRIFNEEIIYSNYFISRNDRLLCWLRCKGGCRLKNQK